MQWKLFGPYEGDASEEDMGPELAIFYNQARFLVIEVGHQPIHKTIKPQPILPPRCAGTVLA